MLPGALGLFAMWCRAFRGAGLWPDQIRRLRLWEIGVLLDGDIAPPGPRYVAPIEPLAPGEKPTGPRLLDVD